MRFLATGDLQVHAFKPFSYTLKNGMNSRLANCLKVFKICREEAKARGINKLLINGDIFEHSDYIEVDPYDSLYRELEKNHDQGLETVINLGNHDIHGQYGKRILHALRPFRRISKIIEKPTLVWESLYIIPWMARPDDIKKSIQEVQANRKICLALHCGVQGAVSGPKRYLVRNPIKLEDVRGDEFGLVILSDYHTRQYLAPNVLYLGSPLQHTFGEVHRPCIWEISLDRESVFRTKKIYTNLPRFRRTRINSISEFHKAALGWRGDYVSIAIGEGIRERDVKNVADEIGFQYKIDFVGEKEGETNLSSTAFNIGKGIRTYVRMNSRGKRAVKLESLGKKLYEGDI